MRALGTGFWSPSIEKLNGVAWSAWALGSKTDLFASMAVRPLNRCGCRAIFWLASERQSANGAASSCGRKGWDRGGEFAQDIP